MAEQSISDKFAAFEESQTKADSLPDRFAEFENNIVQNPAVGRAAKDFAMKALGERKTETSQRVLKEIGALTELNDSFETPLTEVPGNFAKNVGELTEGLTTLGGSVLVGVLNPIDTAKWWVEAFTDPEDEKMRQVGELGAAVGGQLKQEFKELVGLGDISPWESIKRNPLNQVLNVATVLTMGGSGIVKGTQVGTNIAKTAKLGGIVQKVGKAGETILKFGTNIDPIVATFKVAKKIPVVQLAVRRFNNSVQDLKELGISDRIALRQFKNDRNKLDASWGKLTPDEQILAESWIRGTSPLKVSGKKLQEFQDVKTSTLDFLGKYSEEFGFKEVGNYERRLQQTYDFKINKMQDQIDKVSKASKEAADEADSIIKKTIDDPKAANAFDTKRDIMNWIVEKNPGLKDKRRVALMIERKLEVDQLKGQRTALASTTIEEQRAFQDLAVAKGLRTWKDFSDKVGNVRSVLTRAEIDQLKKVADVNYFPDKVIPKKGPLGRAYRKTFFSKKTLGSSRRRTGAAQEGAELLDPLNALKLHSLEVNQHLANIRSTEVILDRLSKEGKVLPVTNEFGVMPGWDKVPVDHLKIGESGVKRVERRIIENLQKDVNISKALENAGEFSKDVADDIARQKMTSVQIPAAEAKAIKSLFPQQGALLQALDSATGIWRTSVLALSPRWIVNGAFGNLVLNTTAGVGPIAYARMFPRFMDESLKAFTDVESVIGRPAAFIGKTAFSTIQKTGKKFEQLVDSFGFDSGKFFIREEDFLPVRLQTGLASAERFSFNFMDNVVRKNADSIVLKKKGFVDAMFDLNGAMDEYFRAVHYLDKSTAAARRTAMRKTGTSFFETMDDVKFGHGSGDLDLWRQATPQQLNKVMDNVEKFLFDYSAMHPFEKTWIRRVIPFWSWSRNINKFFFYDFAQMPARRNVMRQISNIGREAMRDGDVPEWMNTAVQFNFDDDNETTLFINARGMNPFSDLDKGLNDPMHALGFNPLLNIAIERTSGVKSFTGRPFNISDAKSGERAVPPLLEHIARQFPQYKLMEEFMAPGATYDDSTLITPKIIKANDEVTTLQRKIIQLKEKSRPKTRLQKKKRERELASLTEKYHEAQDNRAKELVNVYGIFSKETVQPKYPIDVKFRALKLLGVSITPVKVGEQRERNLKNNEREISSIFNNMRKTNPIVKVGGQEVRFNDFIEQIDLEKARIKETKEFKQKKKKERRVKKRKQRRELLR